MPSLPRSQPAPVRLSRRAFWRRFGRLEHERLEFKRSAHHMLESVVAMAMADGGAILVGVSDDRRIVGCAPVQEALDRAGFVAFETDVELAVRLLHVGGTPVLLAQVPAIRDRVVTTPDGRVLRRVGSANQPVRGDGVARFVRARDAAAACDTAANRDHLPPVRAARIPSTERTPSSRWRSAVAFTGVLVAALLAVAPSALAGATGAVGGVRDPANGTLALTVQASESDGAGLRSAAVSLAGRLLDSAPFADPGCESGSCPQVGTVSLAAPTTGVPDGPQRLEVTVEDGAGRVVHLVDRTVTVANVQPPTTATVTLTVGSNPSTGTSGTPGDQPGGSGGEQPGGAGEEPGAGGEPGGAGEEQAGCQAPRLSVVLSERDVRVRRGLPLLARGRRHRFAGRLTCLVGGRRVGAPRGTPIALRHWARGRIELERVLRAGAGGRFVARVRVDSPRTLAFRARSATGGVVRVRIRVGVAPARGGSA